tara:strand:+ start:1378 stop:1656 length:279 start_codon:yes stop_codon:yes gene_type:complete
VNNGCKYTLNDEGEYCSHVLGIDLEIWFIVISVLFIILVFGLRILIGKIRGEGIADMMDEMIEVDGDGDGLKIGSVGGILSTFSNDDDDDDD